MRTPRGRRGRAPEPEIRIPRRLEIKSGSGPAQSTNDLPISQTTLLPIASVLAPTLAALVPALPIAQTQSERNQEKRDQQLVDAAEMIKKLELGQTLLANANAKMEAEITRLRDAFKNMAADVGHTLNEMKEEGRVQGHKDVTEEIGSLWRSEHFCLELLYGNELCFILNFLQHYCNRQVLISLKSNTRTY